LQFNFKIVYFPSTAGWSANALTQRSQDLPKERIDYSLEKDTMVVKPENIIHAKDIIHALATTCLPLSEPTLLPYTPDTPILS
jgi:hypothetical protein